MTEQESSSGILKWVFGGLGIAGLAGSYLWAFTEELIPSPRELACLVSESFAEPAPGTRFTILISDLDGDSDSRQTKNVRASFLNQDGIHVIRTCRVLKLGSTAEATLLAERKGQRMLWDHNADLLIWGEVAKVDETLRLWFVRRDGGSTIGKSAYRLQNSVLPKDFDDDFAEQLIAVALASILPATEQAGTYLVDLLKPAAEKLERLSAHPPPNLLPEQRGQLHQAFGLASAVIGRQSGDADWLTKAVAAYRAALEERTRARAPLDWATTQNNLGNALQTLGARESGTARLEEAVAAYRAALEERARERVPLQWAGTQNNLGNALKALGEREADTARLEEAVVAYRAALKERARERVPLDWAMTQNNLGNALRALGEREADTTRLEDAVAAYRAALEERIRARVPLQWAMTQYNLGNALQTMGERDAGTARLEEAVAAYRAALEERTRERVPLDWAMIQNNLGNALKALDQREAGTAFLEEAVAAYRGALEVFRDSNAEFYVNVIQSNLASAEAELAKRRRADSDE